MPQASEEISKQLFRFKDQGDRDVCLRFDLTVPFARFVAQHRHELGLPFKRYACGEVFRGERPSFGRYREFTQCDFDFVGIHSPQADCEVIALVVAAMQALGLLEFKVKINNRKIMDALASSLGFSDKIVDVLRVVDKLHKVGEVEVEKELVSLGLQGPAISALFAFIKLSTISQGPALFDAARALVNNSEAYQQALHELELSYGTLINSGIPAQNLTVDFSIARGLGYYTGLVFETTLDALPEIGSVCSGGRYDNLVSSYAPDQIPGVGGSVGLDRLISALLHLDANRQAAGVSKVLIALFSENLRAAAYTTAAKLRLAGIPTEVFPDPVKLGKQLQYAERRLIPHVLLQGEDEIKLGKFSLKTLSSGQQQQFETFESLVVSLN